MEIKSIVRKRRESVGINRRGEEGVKNIGS
jgi:hypothetical protein